jgi:hypothetical protein
MTDLDYKRVLKDFSIARSHPKNFAKFTKIRDENNTRTIDFDLWEWQEELLDTMLSEKYLIILKARQLGVSWLAALLSLWTAMFRPNSNILLLSRGEDDAIKLLDKVRFMLLHLPDHLRPRILKLNDSEIAFGFTFDSSSGEWKERSVIQALPSTEGAGRSQTATLVIADEWAFHPYAEKNFAAIQPTIDQGDAKFIAISTANGTGNFFAVQYKMAQRGEGLFRRVFLPYWLRPGRDEAWWREKQEQYRATPLLLFQEFPRDEDEAFVASGGCIFDTEVLREMESTCRDPLPFDHLRDETLRLLVRDHGLRVWKPWNPAHAYVMWVDPATGEFGRDYTALVVFDVTNREVVATWHGKRDENYVGWICCQVGRCYGDALFGIERNGIGQSILNVVLNHLGYPRSRLYHHRDPNARRDLVKRPASPGWPASRTGNQLMESLGKSAIANRDVVIPDRELIHELKVFVEDPETGKVGARPPDHDDRVRAFLGCLFLAEQPEARSRSGRPVPRSVTKPPSRLIPRKRVMV